MIKFTKKKKVALATAILVLVGGGTAVAYWTAGGTGTGTATTGTSANIVVNQTSPVSGLGPGVAAKNLGGNFTNTTAGPVYVTAVTASIASVAKATGAPAGPCTAADYVITNPVSDVGAEVPVGTGVGSWGVTDTPTIAFVNTTANQDGCKLATVTLAYTAS